MKKMHRSFALSIFAILALFLPVDRVIAMRWQWNHPGAYYGDIPGEVYKEFEFQRNNVDACQLVCGKDDRCRAYTYIIPRGDENGICYLKQKCYLRGNRVQVPELCGPVRQGAGTFWLFAVSSGLREFKLSGNEVRHGNQVVRVAVASRFGLGRLDQTIDPFQEAVGQA